MKWVSGWKARLRRHRSALYPDRQTRNYRVWIRRRLQARATQYPEPVPAGLLAIISAVWDGSPPQFLRVLARSLASQNAEGACEWVIVDNGCTRPELRALFVELQALQWIRVVRFEQNVGIARALRRALETAEARYVLPVDADDDLYPDALRIVASWIQQYNYPPLLYSDEDKIQGTRSSEPYFKPDWDPVLLSNSAYIAHLGVLDREKALQLGVYGEAAVEGSVDWDAFLRFANAGYSALHIREVIYRWRIHWQSTAHDDAAKTFVGDSQRAALEHFLTRHVAGERFTVDSSPLFKGGAHFRLSQKTTGNPDMLLLRLRRADFESSACRFIGTRAASNNSDLVCLICESLEPDELDWPAEAATIFELFPDTAVVGGRIYGAGQRIMHADEHFGFAGACGSPNRGRHIADPGYFGQMWKMRSASAVSSQWVAVRRDFLNSALQTIPADVTIPILGAWLGAAAARSGKRVVYTPFLSGFSPIDFDAAIRPEQRELFAKTNADLIPDRRFYPGPLSLRDGFSIDLSDP